MTLKPDPQDKVFKKFRYHPRFVHLISFLSSEKPFRFGVYAYTQQSVCVCVCV